MFVTHFVIMNPCDLREYCGSHYYFHLPILFLHTLAVHILPHKVEQQQVMLLHSSLPLYFPAARETMPANSSMKILSTRLFTLTCIAAAKIHHNWSMHQSIPICQNKQLSSSHDDWRRHEIINGLAVWDSNRGIIIYSYWKLIWGYWACADFNGSYILGYYKIAVDEKLACLLSHIFVFFF